MKIFVKSLKGNHFQIDVKPELTVSDVKKKFESVQGANVFPASQQMIIYQGKALRDGTTLEENKVAENSFLVVVLCKSKSLPRESSVADTDVPTPKGRSLLVKTPVAAAARPMSKALAIPDSPSVEASTPPLTTVTNASVPASTSTPVSVPINISVPASTSTPVAVPINTSSVSGSDVDCQVASNLVTGNGLENTIQHILDMGGGIWDRDTVVHALRAASNDPERAVEFLYTGIPEQAEAGKPTNASAVSQLPTPATVPSSGPNAGPLNIFPQGFSNLGSDAGPLDFLRHSEQFQVLRAMVQANPQTLQPMLQELGKQNPNLMRLIQERQMDFQRLLYEPVQGEGNILEQFAGAVPQAVQVTPQEHASIERLEAMGFDRSTVLEAYFACNKNEELTANYLLDHMHEF